MRPPGREGLPVLPGPSAAREEDIWRQLYPCFDEAKKERLFRELNELYASAWREPVPEEDVEWARDHREQIRKEKWASMGGLTGIWAYNAYLKSSGGTFDEKPAPPYERVEEAWRAFGERVRHAPAGEGERDMLEAAFAAFSACSGQPVPPCSDHWLAALRAVQAAVQTAVKPFKK